MSRSRLVVTHQLPENFSAMSRTPKNAALPIGSPPTLVDRDLEPLLNESIADAWASPTPPELAAAVRERLQQRLAAARGAAATMTTRRHKRQPWAALAPGVKAQTVYLADADHARRAGEPLRARLIELAPGITLPPQPLDDGAAVLAPHRELLVLSGSVALSGRTLSQRDYHVIPAGRPTPLLRAADGGAVLFWRESDLTALPDDEAHSVYDADAGWTEFGPGIRRRVLWHRDGQGALLYHTDPGAMVPHHAHGHDEECLMLQGELFLDDVLLQSFDYQLAPAGSDHVVTQTDTGVVLYTHGDVDLQFVG